jgi:GNAT superfamily N-acetyltransferase
VRAEVSAAIGWHFMPAEILRPAGTGVVDPSRYAVAVCDGRYVGLARMAPVPRRRPRLGLIAVREDFRRRGAARALLAEVLGALHRTGIGAASAEVDQRNRPAVNLFEGAGANLSGGAVELVYR